jgi:hypothetical protein
MARSSRNKCPPGVFCISGGLGTTLIVLLIVALLFLIVAIFIKPQPIHSVLTSSSSLPSSSPTTYVSSPVIVNGGDSRYDRAPQPLRDWMARPEFPPRGGIASIPINIPTKGLPESFQSVGIVTVDDKILPLYGRRTTGSSDRWNYYTRTDTYNPVPLPIRYQKRDCMDDVGCQEILSGERVKVDGLHKEGKTEIYRYDGPKYIPGLL